MCETERRHQHFFSLSCCRYRHLCGMSNITAHNQIFILYIIIDDKRHLGVGGKNWQFQVWSEEYELT